MFSKETNCDRTIVVVDRNRKCKVELSSRDKIMFALSENGIPFDQNATTIQLAELYIETLNVEQSLLQRCEIYARISTARRVFDENLAHRATSPQA